MVGLCSAGTCEHQDNKHNGLMSIIAYISFWDWSAMVAPWSGSKLQLFVERGAMVTTLLRLMFEISRSGNKNAGKHKLHCFQQTLHATICLIHLLCTSLFFCATAWTQTNLRTSSSPRLYTIYSFLLFSNQHKYKLIPTVICSRIQYNLFSISPQNHPLAAKPS